MSERFNNLLIWVSQAKPGERLLYHSGWLARDRLTSPPLAQVANALYALSDGATMVCNKFGDFVPERHLRIVRLFQERRSERVWDYWAQLRVKPSSDQVFLLMNIAEPRTR